MAQRKNASGTLVEVERASESEFCGRKNAISPSRALSCHRIKISEEKKISSSSDTKANHFAGASSALSPRCVACGTLLPSLVEVRGQRAPSRSPFSSSSFSVIDRRCRRSQRHQDELSALASDGLGQARRLPSEPRQGLGKPCAYGAQQVRKNERDEGRGKEGRAFRHRRCRVRWH